MQEAVRQAAEQKSGRSGAQEADQEADQAQEQQKAPEKAKQYTTVGTTTKPFFKNYVLDPADDLLAKGMWKDPRTGLIWMRCEVGQQWNGSNCIGERRDFSWRSAIESARASTFAGHSDWRVPTVSELVTLNECSSGMANSDGYIKKYPSDSLGAASTIVFCEEGGGPTQANDQLFPSRSRDLWSSTRSESTGWILSGGEPKENYLVSCSCSVRLVRGGEDPGVFKKGLTIVDAMAIQDKRVAVQSQQAQAAATKRIEMFRRGLKPGDKAEQGLVLKVNGDVAHIQTYVKQCVSYSDHINTFSGQHDCLRSEKVSGPTVWVRRDELTPL